jgi:hypothetical protein
MSWPPTISDLKSVMVIDPFDVREEFRLAGALDAAVAFVERARPVYNYTDAPVFTTGADGLPVEVPVPTADLILGTLMLALRWKTRSRSPDGLVNMGELGVGRVPSFDTDIDRLLQIGRFTPLDESFA